MKSIVLHFRNWRIRKTQERAAYWKAKADMWLRVCSGQHTGYERDALVEAVAEQVRYEVRLDSLQNTDVTGDQRPSGGQKCQETEGEMRICFVRFGHKDGAFPPSGHSKNCSTGDLETGVSVYEALERGGKYQILLPRLDGTAPATLGMCFNVAQGLWGMENNPIFEVVGEVVGIGSDGEPLLKNCKVVKRIFELPNDQVERPQKASKGETE